MGSLPSVLTLGIEPERGLEYCWQKIERRPLMTQYISAGVWHVRRQTNLFHGLGLCSVCNSLRSNNLLESLLDRCLVFLAVRIGTVRVNFILDYLLQLIGELKLEWRHD